MFHETSSETKSRTVHVYIEHSHYVEADSGTLFDQWETNTSKTLRYIYVCVCVCVFWLDFFIDTYLIEHYGDFCLHIFC